MAKNTFVQLEQYRRKVAALELKLTQQKKRLAQLPGKMGFKSMSDFIAALQSISEAPKAVKVAGQAKKSRKRAKITAEVIAKVKALVAKKKTGNEIAKEVGISLPSVGNIKKKFGLVRAKK
ncbi:MAG: helix-turn-helix domain-containing protein [Opitutaceae bacterium]